MSISSYIEPGSPTEGTCKPAADFDPKRDAEVIKKAMKGWGCDSKTIVNVLTFRSNEQRQEIRTAFKTMYGKDLVAELVSELRGNLEDVMVALYYTPAEYDAHQLRKAMKGLGTTESTFIEIMIKKAMKGWGCDSKTIVNVLTFRSNEQRQEIRTAFKTMYGNGVALHDFPTDLVAELVSELRGNLEDVMVALCYTPAEYDAHQLRKAMKGLGTTESTLIEIMCSRTNDQINAIKEEYTQQFGRDLEKDLVSETSFHFKRLMVSLCMAQRDESNDTDPEKAAQDAQALFDAGEKKWGTDESVFNAIIAAQNPAQLQLVFQAYEKIAHREKKTEKKGTGNRQQDEQFLEYEKISKHDIEEAIKSEFSGDLQEGLLAVVKCIKNCPAYFAEQLYKSMKGLGTNDNQLIRCVVTRSEVDMAQIKEEFLTNYAQSLEAFIADDCSGKYKDALLNLVRGC